MTEKRAAWLSAALAAAVFLPALHNGFVHWDDFAYLVGNERLAAFDWGWLLGNRMMGVYQPLAWLSYALDRALWGLDPRGYHLTSLLLHAVVTGVFCRLAAEIFRRANFPAARIPWAALLAALLFALHPLRVESVVWASERRDVLCGLFYLLSVLAWLRRAPGWSLGAFVLALSSKGMAVTLPAALVLLDLYPLRRRLSRGLFTEKWPFLAAAAAFGVGGLWSQVDFGNSMEWGNYGLGMRLAQAFYGLAFYAGKTIIPIALSPLYLHPSWNPLGPVYLASTAAVLGAGWLIWKRRRDSPWLAAAFAFYALTLLPVLGLVPYGPQIVADRYSYLACLPWALLAGAWLSTAPRRAAALLFCAALAVGTVRQTAAWRDDEALWRSALAADPENHAALNQLGSALARGGRANEAVPLLERSLSLSETASAHNNLGGALAETGRLREALAHFEAAVRLEPRRESHSLNLARARALIMRYNRGSRIGATKEVLQK